MQNINRRFVFTDYENLLKVKFRKLEKVCDRIFVFITQDQEYIPLSLVKQMQKLGKAVKWIPLQLGDGENANLPLAFIMGRLHQKVALDVEFAVLSNDDSLDTLVNFINDKGRDCLRIQRKKESGEKGQQEEEEPLVFDELSSDNRGDESEPFMQSQFENAIVKDTAKETIRRLVHSGNRPAEIDTLKRYIQLYNQEFTEYDGNVDLIIRHMEDNQEIEIQKGVVKYNF